MTRAERRRQAKMQEKCQVPLNLNLTVAQVAGMTVWTTRINVKSMS